jgi:phosphoglucosamine mutase
MSEIFPIFNPYPCIIRNIRFKNREDMLNSVEQDDVKEEIEKAKKLLGEKSTLIVRKSGTEPTIKLRIEDKNEVIVTEVADNLEKIISKYR